MSLEIEEMDLDKWVGIVEMKSILIVKIKKNNVIEVEEKIR